MDLIYLDHAASTPLLPAVAAAMQPYLLEVHGNPASAHRAGQRARQALNDARQTIAGLLDADADEVIFTSGATEANNLAITGLGESAGTVLVSAVEHPSVLEPARRLNAEVLPVGAAGVVAVERLGSLRPQTRLVSIQYANHETGVVQPIAALARAVGGRALLHCDATQAAGKLPLRFHELGIDALTLSAHKFHGPKGIGGLLVRRGVPLRPLLHGGHQQQGRRPGTESVALAVGLATALKLAHAEMSERWRQVEALRQRFLTRLQAETPDLLINPSDGDRLPHTLNLSFPGCQADILLMKLDLAGVACSTGSACSSGSLLPSPVLQAMGLAGDRLRSAMRFSFSFLLSESAIDQAADRVATAVRQLRETARYPT